MPARAIDIADIDAHVGAELGVSGWFELTQERIEAYAASVEDRHWMHVDLPRAKREIGCTVAPGLMTLGLLFHLRDGIVRFGGYALNWNYGFDRLRFTQPVPAGARIRLRLELLAADRRPDGVLLRTQCTFELEGSAKPALVAEHLSLYLTRAGGAP